MSATSVQNKTETSVPNKGERTVDDVSRAAQDKVEQLEEKARQGIEAGRRKALEAVATVEDLEARAELTIDETTRKVSRYVQENPLQAAGIAFAAGVLTTLIMRRR